MRRKYWLKRIKPPSYLISDYSKPGAMEERYIQEPRIKFINPPEEIFAPEPLSQKSTATVKVDCVVSVNGVACKASAGEINIISRNEPTEPLKNMKKALHPRFVPNAPVLSHDPKYGGWIDPYAFRIKPKKKEEKKFEYY